MKYEELEKIKSLVDDLCLVQAGWRGKEEHKGYWNAMNRITAHGNNIKQENEIACLKERIKELEEKNADKRNA